MNERRVQTEITNSTEALPQALIEPFLMNDPCVGSIRVHQGNFMHSGQIGDDVSGYRICLIIGVAGCKCGCGAPGQALMYNPEPEHARNIAAQLIGEAERCEAVAANAAEAAFARARGK